MAMQHCAIYGASPIPGKPAISPRTTNRVRTAGYLPYSKKRIPLQRTVGSGSFLQQRFWHVAGVAILSDHKTIPYRRRPCKRFFVVRKEALVENGGWAYLTWVGSIYMELTSPNRISGMKLDRDIGVSQPKRW